MTPDLYDRVAPALTVHSRRRGVDARYAPPIVLRALGMTDEGDIQSLTDARKVGNTGDLNDNLARSGASRRFASRSRHKAYTIHARVDVASRTVFERAGIVHLKSRRGLPYEIVDWRN